MWSYVISLFMRVWVDEKSASFGHNVDEFVVALQDIIDGKVDKREARIQGCGKSLD